MSVLEQYLEKNKKLAYDFAEKNTTFNVNGHAVISQDDEWNSETEWDEMFLELSKKSSKGEN